MVSFHLIATKICTSPICGKEAFKLLFSSDITTLALMYHHIT